MPTELLVAKPRMNAREFSEHNWTPNCTRVLLLTQQNFEAREIARELKISKTTVDRIRQSSFFIQKLAGFQTKIINKVTEKRSEMLATDKAREILIKASTAAARKMVELSKEGKQEQRIQLDACKDIMDRAGLKPIEILETRERVYSPEEVTHAKAMLTEAQEIVERLSNQRSPYILRDSSNGKLPSSDTDTAHDVQHKPVPPPETVS